MLAVCEAFDCEWGQCRDGWSKPLRTSSGRAAGLEPDGRRAALAPAQRCSCPSPLTPLATLDPDAYFDQDAEALKALLADGAVMHAGMQACPGPACPCATPPPLLPGPHACPCCCCRAPSADCIVTEQDRVGPDQVARFFSKVRHSWAVGCLRQENDAHARRPPAAAPLNFICALPTAPSPLQYFSNYKSTHFPVVRAVCEKTSSVYCLWDDEVSSRLDLTCQRADLSGGACSGRHHHIHSLAALLPSAPCCHPQNVIQRPESFDEELPAAGSVTSVSGAAARRHSTSGPQQSVAEAVQLPATRRLPHSRLAAWGQASGGWCWIRSSRWHTFGSCASSPARRRSTGCELGMPLWACPAEVVPLRPVNKVRQSSASPPRWALPAAQAPPQPAVQACI